MFGHRKICVILIVLIILNDIAVFIMIPVPKAITYYKTRPGSMFNNEISDLVAFNELIIYLVYIPLMLALFLRNLHHKKCSIEKIKPNFTFKVMMKMLRGIKEKIEVNDQLLTEDDTDLPQVFDLKNIDSASNDNKG
jgi:hypothetical protein